jgi:(+)-pinoresinol hydroxylase
VLSWWSLWGFAKEKFSVIPGVKFQDGASHRFPLTPEQISQIVDAVPFGIPSLQTFSILGPRGQGHLGFSPFIPMTGEAVLESQKVFEQVYKDLLSPGGAAAAFPVFSFFARAFVIIDLFPVVHDVETNRQIYRRLIKESAERDWGEYRTHTTFMSDIAATCSFNDHALLRLHETMKDALDPNGVLSPGKNGIWPKSTRKARA